MAAEPHWLNIELAISWARQLRVDAAAVRAEAAAIRTQTITTSAAIDGDLQAL